MQNADCAKSMCVCVVQWTALIRCYDHWSQWNGRLVIPLVGSWRSGNIRHLYPDQRSRLSLITYPNCFRSQSEITTFVNLLDFLFGICDSLTLFQFRRFQTAEAIILGKTKVARCQVHSFHAICFLVTWPCMCVVFPWILAPKIVIQTTEI